MPGKGSTLFPYNAAIPFIITHPSKCESEADSQLQVASQSANQPNVFTKSLTGPIEISYRNASPSVIYLTNMLLVGFFQYFITFLGCFLLSRISLFHRKDFSSNTFSYLFQ